MNKKIGPKVILFGILITFILCINITLGLSAIGQERGVSLKVEKEWKGVHCSYTKATTLIIRTEEQWRGVWQNLHVLRLPKPKLPKIDFQKEMAIAVFMGECPSGGYSTEITKIIKTEKEILVVVEEKEPPLDSLRTLVLTQPYHIVIVKKSALPVKFNLQKIIT